MSWSAVTPSLVLFKRLPACSVGSQSRVCFSTRQVEGSSLLLILSVFLFLFFRETGINALRQTARVFEAVRAADTASGCTRQNLWHGVWRCRLLIKGSGLKGGGVVVLPSLPPSSCDEEKLNTNQMQRLKSMCISSQCIEMPQKHAGQHYKSFDLQFCFICQKIKWFRARS